MAEAFTPKSKMGSEQTQEFSFLVKISDEDFSKKLIPTGFLKPFNGVVPDEIILRTSSYGRCWLIKLKRAEENLFFQQGWLDFVEYHSLELGDSLILEYIGNSQFYVKIYGKNCCEKESPMSEIPSDLGKKNEQELKSKEKHNTHVTDPEYKYYCEAKRGRDSVGSDKNKKNCGSFKCVEPTRHNMAVNNGRTGVPQAGCSYNAERPYFILTWPPKKEYEMEIPREFLRKVGGELPDAVSLIGHGGIIWPVGLRKTNGRVWFQNGWKQFIEHQSLTDRHFLIFRFDGNSRFDVSFNVMNISDYEESFETKTQDEKEDEDYMECFDVNDSSSSIEVLLTAKKQAVNVKKKTVSAAEMAGQFKSKHPFFAVTLRPSYMNYLPIPTTFGERHLPENLVECMIRLEVSDGGTWLVKCLAPSPGRNDFKLCKGVPNFMKGNNLVEGDACIFEAIKNNSDFVFKVHIFRNPRL